MFCSALEYDLYLVTPRCGDNTLKWNILFITFVWKMYIDGYQLFSLYINILNSGLSTKHRIEFLISIELIFFSPFRLLFVSISNSIDRITKVAVSVARKGHHEKWIYVETNEEHTIYNLFITTKVMKIPWTRFRCLFNVFIRIKTYFMRFSVCSHLRGSWAF